MIIILFTLFIYNQNYNHMSYENKFDSLASDLVHHGIAQKIEIVLLTDESFELDSFNKHLESIIDTMYYTHGGLLVIRYSSILYDTLIYGLLQKYDGIKSRSTNRPSRASYVPSDIHANSWNLRNLGQTPASGNIGSDVNMIKAWDISIGSSSVHIAILDSGIPMNTAGSQLNHPDLSNSNRIILGSTPIPDFIDESRWHIVI